MKYRYALQKRSFVVLFPLLSLLVVLINVIGLSRYPYISILNLLIVLSAFTESMISAAYLTLGFKEFNVRKHRSKVRDFLALGYNEFPSVDIFLPCAGEDIKTLERTYEAVSVINYPRKRLSVFVLDDAKSKSVRKLAKRYGFRYLSRPNRGEFKKAGNLNYGYTHSKGDHILVLDADFAPNKRILLETLPYLESDPEIGIVITPQDFILNKEESTFVQKGDLAIQEYFYRVCQPGRNGFGASICTGTNSVYRRSALETSGGFYQIEHSEDIYTGMSQINQGYSQLYLPLVLALGYCPSDYKSLYKQRSRWCQGSLTLMTSSLFWNTDLSFMALLSHFSGFMYYLSSSFFLITPFYTLYLFSQPQNNDLITALFFLPNVLYVLFSYGMFYYPRFNFAVLGNQLFFCWTYLFATIKTFVLKQNEIWTPTGTKQGKNNTYSTLLAMMLLSIGIYWVFLLRILATKVFSLSLEEFVIVFWIVFNVASQVSFLYGLVATSLHKWFGRKLMSAQQITSAAL